MTAAPFFPMSDSIKKHAAHAITHLRSLGGLKLTKQYSRDKNGSVVKKIYDNAKHFNAFSKSIHDIHALSQFLKFLEKTPNACIIRGELKEEHEPIRVRRSLDYFSDEPRSWVCIDIDAVPVPDHTDVFTEVEILIEHVIGFLPPEFHDVSCHYQFSSSFGTEGLTGEGGPGQTIKVHLWFMLDHPCTSKELRRWAKHVNRQAGFKLIDESLYNPVQIHYTANPIFSDLRDPVRVRSGFLERLDDAVAIEIPSEEKLSSVTLPSGQGLSTSNIAPGFENHLASIGDPHGFNIPIYKAIWSYLATCRNKGISGNAEELKHRLKERIAIAENWTRSQSEIDRYMSDELLDDQIRRAQKKFMEQTEAQASQVVVPTYPDHAVSLEAARNMNKEFIGDFFWKDMPDWYKAMEEYYEAHRAWKDRKENAKSRGELFLERPPLLPEPPLYVAGPDVGVGKTHDALDGIAREIFRKRYLEGKEPQPFLWMAPSHALAEETRSRAVKKGIKKTGVFKGRYQDHPSGTGKMCTDKVRPNAVLKFNGSVRNHACGNGSKGFKCPSYEECEYQKQRKALVDDDLVIMTDNMLFLPPPLSKFSPQAVIIDESPVFKALPKTPDETDFGQYYLVQERTVPDLPWCDGKTATKHLMDCSYRLHKAFESIPKGDLTREALEAQGITAEACQKAARYEGARIEPPENITPVLTTEMLVKRAEKATRLGPFYLLTDMWNLLFQFLDDGTQDICVTVKKQSEGTIRILSKKRIYEDYELPTLLLDATYRERLLETVIRKPTRSISLEVQKPYQHVRQIIDTNVAVSSFLENDEITALARNVYNHIRLMAAFYAGKSHDKIDVLVVCPMPIEKILRERFPALPENVDIEHFNNLRGRNEWEGVSKLIVVSRLLPTVDPVEQIAETFTQRGIPRLPVSEDNKKQFLYMDKYIRLADDKALKVAGQRYHPDLVAEDIRYTITEGELIQAIGRARGVNRTKENPLSIDIITNTVLPITVHETLTLHELMPNEFDLMIANGAVPTGATDQAVAYSELFVSRKAAESKWERIKVNFPRFTIKDYIIAKCRKLMDHGANAPLTHEVKYRNAGARGRAKTFLYNSGTVKSPLQWLCRNIGADIEIISKPEELPWSDPKLPWNGEAMAAQLVSENGVDLLPMPDLDQLKRKERSEEQEMIFTLEELREQFGKSAAEMQAMLKRHKSDEYAVVAELICYEVISTSPKKRITAYKRLPEQVQKFLDIELLDKLPFVQDLPPVSIITGRPD